MPDHFAAHDRDPYLYFCRRCGISDAEIYCGEGRPCYGRNVISLRHRRAERWMGAYLSAANRALTGPKNA